jgi:hypothetical protein
MNYSTDLLGNTIFLSRTVKYCEIFVKKKEKRGGEFIRLFDFLIRKLVLLL